MGGSYVRTLPSEFQMNGMFTIRERRAGEEHLPTVRGAIQINQSCGLAIKRNPHYTSIQAEIA